ncbi:MAG: uracil-DNA glycosylase [Gemmatimonadota bacterium]|nr:uracil-DNA glycosylase [Gemmatimonadota bacterium]
MSPGARDPVELARRFFRGQRELGVAEVILEEVRRDEALRLVRRAGRGGGVVVDARPGDAGAARGAAARSAPSGPVGDDAIAAARDLDALAELVAGCTRCALHGTRTKPVFGEGAADARVVCVGEAPGAREDETGRPFVGRAGQLLDRLLLTVGLARESVYICNVLKSRPPNNRDPLPDEVEACSPYLLRQLALIRPEVIVAFGAFAARTLLDSKSALGRMRGTVHRYAGYPVVVTYHPAALLRNPGWTRPAWEDLQVVRRILDGESADG